MRVHSFILVLLAVSAGPCAAQNYARAEYFGDWQYVCFFAEQNEHPSNCSLTHIAHVEHANALQSALEITIVKNDDQGASSDLSLIVRTPLDVALSNGFGMRIDRRSREVFPYRNCSTQGCFVKIPLTRDRDNRLKRGYWAKFVVEMMSEETFEISVSLIGMTKALNALSSNEIPAGPKLKVLSDA